MRRSSGSGQLFGVLRERNCSKFSESQEALPERKTVLQTDSQSTRRNLGSLSEQASRCRTFWPIICMTLIRVR